jgi:hypothetical protein
VVTVLVVVTVVGGGLEVVEVGVLVLVGVEVGVLVGVGEGVGVLVGVGALEPQDTVNATYWFWPLEVTVVLAGLIVQPGTVVAVSVTLAPGQ